MTWRKTRAASSPDGRLPGRSSDSTGLAVGREAVAEASVAVHAGRLDIERRKSGSSERRDGQFRRRQHRLHREMARCRGASRRLNRTHSSLFSTGDTGEIGGNLIHGEPGFPVAVWSWPDTRIIRNLNSLIHAHHLFHAVPPG